MMTPFTTSPSRSRVGLITLGWPQFVALAVSLFALSVTLAIVLVFDVTESLYRFDVQQYEQRLGFEVGMVKGLPPDPSYARCGFVRVTPGGVMDRAGMRSGDILFRYHGDVFSQLSWAIREAAEGRTACVFVINAEEARTGSGRDVCLKGATKH